MISWDILMKIIGQYVSDEPHPFALCELKIWKKLDYLDLTSPAIVK